MKKLDIGPGQMKVLRILWEKKAATAQEVTLLMQQSEPVKFSTVATFLRTLVKKGLADYRVENRTFVYFPTVEPEQIEGHAVRDVIDRVFAGSLTGFVSFMMKHSYLDADEIEAARKLIDAERDGDER